MHRRTALLTRASLYGRLEKRHDITSEESFYISKVWILDIGSIVHRSTASLSHASLYRNLVNGPAVIHDECSAFAMGPVSPHRPLPSPFIKGRSLFHPSQWHDNLAIKSKEVHMRSRPARVYHQLFFHLLPSIRLARLRHGSARASAGSSTSRSTLKSSVICYRGFCDCWSAPLTSNFPTKFPRPPTQYRLHHHTTRHTALQTITFYSLHYHFTVTHRHITFYLTHSYLVSITQAHPYK